jgi:hypothetical protein
MFYLDGDATGASPALMKHFTSMITTGEVLPPPVPQDLQNISYSLDLTLPILRCLPSNDTVIAWTAAAAVETAMYNRAFYGDIFQIDTGPTTIETNTRNLTWTMNNTLSGQIGYYGTGGNTSATNSALWDFWIVILESNNTSYYTCGIQNASIPTNITFVNNVLDLQTGSIRILEVVQNITDDYWSLLAYNSFGFALSSFLFDCVANFDVLPGSWGSSKNGTLDTTVFGTASDYYNVSYVWDAINMNPTQGIVSQSKNLVTLIEEVALNASLSLMSNSFARQVLDFTLKYYN